MQAFFSKFSKNFFGMGEGREVLEYFAHMCYTERDQIQGEDRPNSLNIFCVICVKSDEMKEILHYLKPYRGKLGLSIGMVAVSTFCNLLLPTIMSSIVNNGVANADFSYIVKCCGQMLLVALVGLSAVLLGVRASAQVVAGFCADLRRVVFAKVNTLTFEEFGAIGTAALVTRSTHDIDTLSWVASMLAGTVVTIPVLFLGGVLLALSKDVVLSLILLCFIPVIFVAVVLIGRHIDPLWKQSDEYVDRQNDILRERLWGIRVIRAFNKEPHEHERVSEATRVMAMNIIKANTSMGAVGPLSLFVFNAAALLIVYVGGGRMEALGSPSAGDIFAIVQYIGLVMNGVLMAAFAIVMAPHAKVAAERIAQVTHAKGMAEEEAEDAVFRGEVEFDHVTFRYADADEPAVSDISFRIRAGQKVSIIGGTGSGKSTLVQLMLAFRAPTEGTIRFDGEEASHWGARTIRRNISAVLQKTAIYSGTVRENLLMGDQTADDERLREAVHIAQIGDFIETLEGGYDHELQQAGKNFSGGQKQRLAIARAVLKDAPIYLFDDSFSALDFLTEAKLREELNTRMAGRTRIVITQRVTSAMDSDCIFVMDQGRLVDAGKHQELLERCGIYREIYASQTGGERL